MGLGSADGTLWDLGPACVFSHPLSPLSHLTSAMQSQSSGEMANQAKNPRGPRRREQVHHGKMQAKLRLMRVREAQSRKHSSTDWSNASQFPPLSKPMGTLNYFYFADGERNGLYQVTQPENSGAWAQTVKIGVLSLD